MNTKFDLSTYYLGLTLKNPIVITSSIHTSTVENVIECAEAGAGAVVLKSIFEEEILQEAATLQQHEQYPEAADYLTGYSQLGALGEYINLIEQCSQRCEIPIIASINCSSIGKWIDYAVQIERAGASALELNIFLMPSDANVSGADIEQKYLDIVQSVKDVVSIPLSVKLPRNFTAPLNLVQQLYFRGVKAVTMFNRFYSPDVELRNHTLRSSNVFSTESELSEILRWVSLSSTHVPLVDVLASGGVHSAEAAIKAILCGATAVGICSLVYRRGVVVIPSMISEIEKWASENNFKTVKDMRGVLSAKDGENAEIAERAQFMKYFSASKEIL